MVRMRVKGESIVKAPRPRRGSLVDNTRFKGLCAQWHPGNYFGPECFGPFSTEIVRWVCRRKKGRTHTFRARIGARARAMVQGIKGWGCPFCSGRRRDITPVERLSEVIASEWLSQLNGLAARWLSNKSARNGMWQCSYCHHQWRTKASSRKDQGCPRCYQRQQPDYCVNIRTHKDAKHLFDKSGRNAGYDTKKLPKFFKVFWICRDNPKHVFYRTYANLKNNNFDCPRCQTYLSDYPDLVKDYDPKLNDYETADKVCVNKQQSRTLTWSCDEGDGHIWQARIYDRLKRKDGCPFCSGRKSTYATSLEELHPEVAQEFHTTKNGGLKPWQVAANTTKKVWFCCKHCQHEWQTQVRLRTGRKQGCPKCKGRKQQ